MFLPLEIFYNVSNRVSRVHDFGLRKKLGVLRYISLKKILFYNFKLKMLNKYIILYKLLKLIFLMEVETKL